MNGSTWNDGEKKIGEQRHYLRTAKGPVVGNQLITFVSLHNIHYCIGFQ